MPAMSYNSGELRTGSSHAHDAARHGDSAAAALDLVGGATPFGQVSGSGEMHSAVHTAREHHRVGAQHDAQNMTAAGQRASGAAALGDANTAATTRVAPRSAQAGAVARGM